jgi:hypothetical protein
MTAADAIPVLELMLHKLCEPHVRADALRAALRAALRFEDAAARAATQVQGLLDAQQKRGAVVVTAGTAVRVARDVYARLGGSEPTDALQASIDALRVLADDATPDWARQDARSIVMDYARTRGPA